MSPALVLLGVGGRIISAVRARRLARVRALQGDDQAEEAGGRGWGFEKGVLWFVPGFALAFWIFRIGLSMADGLRGPVRGISPLFTPEYEQPQRPLGMTMTAGVLLAGWGVGVRLYRVKGLRAPG